jgi:hypothetical protein
MLNRQQEMLLKNLFCECCNSSFVAIIITKHLAFFRSENIIFYFPLYACMAIKHIIVLFCFVLFVELTLDDNIAGTTCNKSVELNKQNKTIICFI